MKKRLLSPHLTHKPINSISYNSKNNNNNYLTNKATKNNIMKNKQTRNINKKKIDTKEKTPITRNNNSSFTEPNTMKFLNKLKYKRLSNVDKKYRSPKCNKHSVEHKINSTRIFKEKFLSYKNILDSLTARRSFRTIGNSKSSFDAISPKRNDAHKNRYESTIKSLYKKLLIDQKSEIEKIQTKIKTIKELKNQIRIRKKNIKLNITDNSNTDNSENDITRQEETEITFYNNNLSDTKKEFLPIKYFEILREDFNSYYNNGYITSLKSVNNNILIKDLKNLINKGIQIQMDHQKNYEILIKDFNFYKKIYKKNNKNYRLLFKKCNKLKSKLLNNDYAEEINRYNLVNEISSRRKIIENNELNIWNCLISNNIYDVKDKNKIIEIFLYICNKYQNCLNKLSLRFYSNLKKRYNRNKINCNDMKTIENDGHYKRINKNNKSNKKYNKPICVLYNKKAKNSSSNTPKFRSIDCSSKKKKKLKV